MVSWIVLIQIRVHLGWLCFGKLMLMVTKSFCRKSKSEVLKKRNHSIKPKGVWYLNFAQWKSLVFAGLFIQMVVKIQHRCVPTYSSPSFVCQSKYFGIHEFESHRQHLRNKEKGRKPVNAKAKCAVSSIYFRSFHSSFGTSHISSLFYVQNFCHQCHLAACV